jgi:uncharacterized protein
MGMSSLPTPQPMSSLTPSGSRLRRVFLGTKGLRAGWRLLLFILFLLAFQTAIRTILNFEPTLRRILQASQREGMTASFNLLFESTGVAAVFLATFIMARIENRPFGAFGIPFRLAFRKLFWLGVVWGLAAESLAMLAMSLLHGFSLGTLAVSGLALVKYAALWAAGDVLVGTVEESAFRGYAQFTLAEGIGFWPAAFVLSAIFGVTHLGNPNEGWVGALFAMLFGLFACFTLRRTGTLWFAIGLHGAFDYSEDFIYSVPDSGFRAIGHLLNSSFHGPRWLTGGAVGPEGSVLTFGVLLLSFVLFAWLYPAKKPDTSHEPIPKVPVLEPSSPTA